MLASRGETVRLVGEPLDRFALRGHLAFQNLCLAGEFDKTLEPGRFASARHGSLRIELSRYERGDYTAKLR
jgi:hypothetical protein